MRALDGELAARAVALIRALRDAGHQAYLAGGCVRDLLLDVPPKDYDVATSATPGQALALFPDANRVGAHFGVILAQGIEIATFRSDHSYADGRRPESVTYETSPEADAARRDFTINGMFLDPGSGRVLDFVGGQPDLASRLIRAIGNPAARFAEDHLRMLRAIRFAARLDFTLDAATEAALSAEALAIHKIAAERVREELTRILTEGGARPGFEMLHRTGLLSAVLPEIAGLENSLWIRALDRLAGLRRPSLTLAWGALLHDLDPPAAARLLARLRHSQASTARILSFLEHRARWFELRDLRESLLKRFLRMEGFDEHLELHRLDAAARGGSPGGYDFARERLRQLPPGALTPPRLITGDDLIAAGWEPGPLFARILTEVEDAQLEGRITSREEALAYAAAVSSERSGA